MRFFFSLSGSHASFFSRRLPPPAPSADLYLPAELAPTLHVECFPLPF